MKCKISRNFKGHVRLEPNSQNYHMAHSYIRQQSIGQTRNALDFFLSLQTLRWLGACNINYSTSANY